MSEHNFATGYIESRSCDISLNGVVLHLIQIRQRLQKAARHRRESPEAFVDVAEELLEARRVKPAKIWQEIHPVIRHWFDTSSPPPAGEHQSHLWQARAPERRCLKATQMATDAAWHFADT